MSAIANRAALGFISQGITDLHANCKRILRSIIDLHNILVIHLNSNDYFHFLKETYRKSCKAKTFIEQWHARKFGRMMASKYPIYTNEKAVHNLTKVNLNILQIAALTKIDKFAMPPLRIPKLDIITASERCLAKFYDRIKDHNEFRAIIANAISKCRHFHKPNLNPYELTYIRSLNNHASLMVTQADKGGGVVLMYKDDYHKMALEHLKDDKVYKKSNYSLGVYQQRIVDCLQWAQKERNLSSYYVNKGIIKDPSYPCIKFLPKTHKGLVDGVYKARPIVNTRGSPLQGISNILFSILRPYAARIPHCLKNGLQVVEDLQRVDFTNCQMFSFDVKSMYTSMSYSIVKPAIAECLNGDARNLLRSHDMLPEHIDYLIWTLTTQQFFVYNNVQYQQIEGLFMGLAASGPIADLTMLFLEKRMFNLYPELQFYGRYVDDTLVVCNRVTAKKIFDFLDNFHPSLSFEMEESINGKINFLDLSIAVDKYDQLHTAVYRKPTCSSRFIFFSSYAPMAHKVNTVDFMLRRAFFYSSSLNNLAKEVDFCINVLMRHGYPYKLIMIRLKLMNESFNNSEMVFFRDIGIPRYYGIIDENNQLSSFTDNVKWKDVTFKRRTYKNMNSMFVVNNNVIDTAVCSSNENFSHKKLMHKGLLTPELVVIERNICPIPDKGVKVAAGGFMIQDCVNEPIVKTCSTTTAIRIKSIDSDIVLRHSNSEVISNPLLNNSSSDDSDFVGFTDKEIDIAFYKKFNVHYSSISTCSSICSSYNDLSNHSSVYYDSNNEVSNNETDNDHETSSHSSSSSSASFISFNGSWHANEYKMMKKKNPNNYAVFPYYPPIIANLKKLLHTYNIIPSYKSTHPLKVISRNPNPEGIVYSIPCFQCSRPYVGQTKFNLGTRLRQHIKGFEDLDPDQSGTVKHYFSCGHSPNFAQAHHVLRVPRFRDRAIAEAYFILIGSAYNSATIGKALWNYFKIDNA